MSPNDIQVGKTYHNGKTGKSRSVRQVTEQNVSVWWDPRPMLRYEQLAGPYKGRPGFLCRESSAKWAKGEVSPHLLQEQGEKEL